MSALVAACCQSDHVPQRLSEAAALLRICAGAVSQLCRDARKFPRPVACVAEIRQAKIQHRLSVTCLATGLPTHPYPPPPQPCYVPHCLQKQSKSPTPPFLTDRNLSHLIFPDDTTFMPCIFHPLHSPRQKQSRIMSQSAPPSTPPPYMFAYNPWLVLFHAKTNRTFEIRSSAVGVCRPNTV